MEFSIDCGVFSRLSKISRSCEDKFLRSVRLEIKDGYSVAMVTSRLIMAIEFLGEDNSPDFSMNAVVDDALIKQCDLEKAFDSKLNFEYNPTLDYTMVKTSLGYSHPGNASIPKTTSCGVIVGEENITSKWRDVLPKKLPAETTGGMFSNMNNLALLASTAPSGLIIFPECIDVDQPVIVNDVHDPNWLGVFMSRPENMEAPDPVTIPGWIK